MHGCLHGRVGASVVSASRYRWSGNPPPQPLALLLVVNLINLVTIILMNIPRPLAIIMCLFLLLFLLAIVLLVRLLLLQGRSDPVCCRKRAANTIVVATFKLDFASLCLVGGWQAPTPAWLGGSASTQQQNNLQPTSAKLLVYYNVDMPRLLHVAPQEAEFRSIYRCLGTAGLGEPPCLSNGGIRS